jgi:hypothetical protein
MDPHQLLSEKLDRIRIKVKSWIRNRIKVKSWIRNLIKMKSWIRNRIKVKSWIRLRIKVKTWIRDFIKAMRIRTPSNINATVYQHRTILVNAGSVSIEQIPYTCTVGPSLDPRANRLGPPRGTRTHQPSCWPTPMRLQTGKFPSVARVFLQYPYVAQTKVFVIKYGILVLHSLSSTFFNSLYCVQCRYTFYEVYTSSRHQAK